MKTIVIGNGYVGKALLAQYQKEALCLDHKSEPLVRLEEPRLDLLNLDFSEYRWAVVGSAITNVAFCEREKEFSRRCNVTGTLQLVDQILTLGMTPIVFSSDYVFDGMTGGYDELSSLNPLNEYGRQKAAVEEALPRLCGDDYLLLRLSKVIGKDPFDKTVITGMVRQLLKKEKVRAARDQLFCPIFIEDVVLGVMCLQKERARGLYHLCGREKWNRLELARLIAKNLGMDEGLVESISLDDLGELFSRPKKTDMSSEKFVEKTQYPLQSISQFVDTLRKNHANHSTI